MDSQKVYQSVIELLNVLLKDEKLKYWVLKDEKFQKQVIGLINDLVTLEKEHQASFEDQEWAVIFGKAVVLLTDQKHRFQRLDNRDVDAMYKDYTDLIAYIAKKYDFKQSQIDPHQRIHQEDILTSAKLSSATINKFDEQEQAKIKTAKEAEKKQTVEPEVGAGNFDENVQRNQESNHQSHQNNFFNPLQQGLADMPSSPAVDPRFYPYSTKPKWMPIFKMILGVIGIISAIVLIAANAYAISVSFTLNGSVDKIANNGVNPMLDWTIVGTNTESKWHVLSDVTNKYNLAAMGSGGFLSIITFVFYTIPVIYLGYACFARPKSNREKYRISYFALFFTILFFALSIIQIYRFASPDSLKQGWKNFYSNSFDNYNETTFNTWWEGIMRVYPVRWVTIFIDISLAFLGITLIMCLFTLIVNPRPDRNKMVKANAEYQQAIVATMQGQSYTYDESLFDNDEVIIKNKSKFRLWVESLFKHKSKKDSSDKNDNN